ncbi:CBM9 family sugar-binding protein [Lacimicrobium alkaliphilum]|uniref:Sugar-binding protein n=1 Tax=Lacimicrobium alkaliphilum TaxID=1526571 RepID=A0A0U2ZLP7_9ALTE|nr:CBM9 family sugar-binding protein [Lacimicrobium alkaliphilum]ALS99911.1 sugar-binding protein [Lacimicrobium alkaliphilum]
MKLIAVLITIVLLMPMLAEAEAEAEAESVVLHTAEAPVIDGRGDDPAWQQAQWRPMPYLITGSMPSAEDFSGRFKLLWDKDYLYLQAEITDDVLYDAYPDPLKQYWDDDALEIFIDSDASGGGHQYNHSAFAYHIALDNQAVDLGDNRQPRLYNEHLQSRWQRSAEAPHVIIWEVAIRLYPDDYRDDQPNRPLLLDAGRRIGFMLAYCDNDGSAEREHFVGSVDIEPVEGDRNRGWIDASVFETMILAPSANNTK